MGFQPFGATDKDFQLLGLTARASRDDVKAAYRRLAKECHPDRFQQRPLWERERAEEKFKELTMAYRRIAETWVENEPEEDSAQSKPQKQEDPISRGQGKARPNARPPHSPKGPGARRSKRPSGRARSWAFGLALLALTAFLGIRTYLSIVEIHEALPSENGHTIAPSDTSSSPLSLRGNAPSPPVGAQEVPAHEHEPRVHPPLSEEAASSKTGREADYFSIGSSQEEVLSIQGPPQHIRGQTWVYGVSEVSFKDGHVVRYNNFDGNLRIRILSSRPSTVPSPEAFSVGSSQDEVLAVQGTPSRIDGNRWLFGFSEVRFKEGKVEEYDNFFGDLKVRMISENDVLKDRSQGSFTQGSSKSDVLQIQGTPTSIRGNLWYYQMSSILFRNDKVHYVFNTSGNLRYVPREELTRNQ